ncbi:hypothetical protein AB4072_07240 [Microvirga sp. 2MCAF38]
MNGAQSRNDGEAFGMADGEGARAVAHVATLWPMGLGIRAGRLY